MLTKFRAWIARDLIAWEHKCKVAAFDEAALYRTEMLKAREEAKVAKQALVAAHKWTALVEAVLTKSQVRHEIARLAAADGIYALYPDKQYEANVRNNMAATLINAIFREWLRGVGVTFEKANDIASGYAVMTVRTKPGVWHQSVPLK